MRDVYIIGTSCTAFGKRPDAGFKDLTREAYLDVLADAGLETGADIEMGWFGNCGMGTFGQRNIRGQVCFTPLVREGLFPERVGMINVEGGCATASMAFHGAWKDILSGQAEVSLAIGVEKMNAVSSVRATELMARAGDTRWEYPFGVSFPGFYALFATRHMHEYGTTKEQLAMVGVKNHHYGAMNPVAHLPKEVPLEEAVNAMIIAWPLGLYDCCLISDGGAAAILMSEEKAREYTDTPVWIKGIGSGSDTMLVAERPSLTSLSGAKSAGQIAYRMAGIEPKDVDVAEVHDCFTIAEIMAYEDLGFCKPGEGGKFIEEKQSYIGGQTPVNVDGGLKSKGHPIGATGVSQCVELAKQLRGECDRRQVDGAEIALSHNVGQTGQFANVIIYTR